jgi:hypothetical protein
VTRYRILGDIVLSFIVGNDQADFILGPDAGVIEFDGSTLWLVKASERHESISEAAILDLYLNRGLVEQIYTTA